MIEGMIGGIFILVSFVGGYFFRGKQESKPVQDIQQDSQLPPHIEEQLNNIANAWK